MTRKLKPSVKERPCREAERAAREAEAQHEREAREAKGQRERESREAEVQQEREARVPIEQPNMKEKVKN